MSDVSTFPVTDRVTGIDCEMFGEGVLAAYLIDDPEPTLVETGCAAGVDTLRAGVRAAGVEPAALANAVVSHVHLDHSGGAAALVADAPDLSVYVHESTADYLVEPGALVDSSKRAMGEHFAAVGAPDPLPAENLVRVGDGGTVVETGARSLELLHTPGHAPDHIAAWDGRSGTAFVTEAIGSYYGRAGQHLPPVTLPRFDAAAVEDSIDSLRALDPERVVFSHFGVRSDPEAAFEDSEAALALFLERVPELFEANDRDLAATEAAVREQLLDLEGYAEGIQAFESRFQTRGILRHEGLLESSESD